MPGQAVGDPDPDGAEEQAAPQDTIIDVDLNRTLRGWRRVISDWIHQRVGIYTLTEQDGAYTLDYDTVPRKKIPKEALAVAGEGRKCFFLDLVDSGSFPMPMHATATDLYCWYRNNSLDDAIISQHKNVPMSKRMLIYLGVGVVAVVLIAVFYL